MVPRGTIPRRAAANCRLTRPISSQSAAARWASCGDSPCEAQTPPPRTNPGRPPSSRHINASAESWCAGGSYCANHGRRRQTTEQQAVQQSTAG